MIETKIIGPEAATELLSKNTKNRSAKKSNVTFLAKQMSEGKWRNNGETLKFSKTNKLLDGQHRLLAVIECGVAQSFTIVKGLDDDVFATIDSGKRRDAADNLAIAGYSYGPALAAIIKQVIKFGNTGRIDTAGTYIIPSADIIKKAADRPDLGTSAAFVLGKGGSFVRPSIVQFCHYYFSIHNNELSNGFFDILKSGYGNKGCPVLALRNMLINLKLNDKSMSLKDTVAYFCRAFELYEEGREVGTLRLRLSSLRFDILINAEIIAKECE